MLCYVLSSHIKLELTLSHPNRAFYCRQVRYLRSRPKVTHSLSLQNDYGLLWAPIMLECRKSTSPASSDMNGHWVGLSVVPSTARRVFPTHRENFSSPGLLLKKGRFNIHLYLSYSISYTLPKQCHKRGADFQGTAGPLREGITSGCHIPPMSRLEFTKNLDPSHNLSITFTRFWFEYAPL